MMIGMLDIIFFVVILITSVAAAYRGFIKEVLGKAAWVLAVLLSVFLYKNVAVLFESSIKSETLRYICSFVCLFLGVFLIVKIVEIILSKIFSGEITGGLNRAMGFLFGIAEGLVFVFAFLFVLHVQPWFNTKGIIEDSIFNNFFEQKIEKTVYPEIIIPAFSEDPSGEDA